MDPFRGIEDTRKKLAPPRAATNSRIGNLTVGDVRYVFSQLRESSDIDPDFTLWCGLTAGEFSLQYLLCCTTSDQILKNTSKKRKKV